MSFYLEGLVTDDRVDLDGQIVDHEFAARALARWALGACRDVRIPLRRDGIAVTCLTPYWSVLLMRTGAACPRSATSAPGESGSSARGDCS